MSVDEKAVRRAARLARLAVPEDRLAPLAAELSGILAWVEQLNELDTQNVEPMTSVRPMRLYRRADVVTDGFYAEDIVKNAPRSEDNFFVVPKVVE
ncbi:MAG: Asp-tRNA(Asn)/Glu-tRNA(Gln) amidotransferase subunit GatC [Alphaproteobacteria bacterium]|nr:Asp-tRNA(Asn)/Glu-tRNA(Gln) amidotransferase subunit GatC [Alphaproteobacteria bacterium]